MPMTPTGYFPEPTKTYIVVDESDFEEAQRLFEPLGVNVTVSHRLLGGHLDSSAGRSLFVQEKAAEWVDHLTCLSAVRWEASTSRVCCLQQVSFTGVELPPACCSSLWSSSSCSGKGNC